MSDQSKEPTAEEIAAIVLENVRAMTGEEQDLPDATASKIERYNLTDAERSAVSEAQRQETALKSSIYDLQEKLKQIGVMRNGVLQLIAFQQGLAGNWTLTPDGSALTKE